MLREVPPQLQRLLVATRLHRILAVEGMVADPCGATVPGGTPGQSALPSVIAPSR